MSENSPFGFPGAAATPAQPPMPPPPHTSGSDEEPGRRRRIIQLGLGGAGVAVVLGIAAVLTLGGGGADDTDLTFPKPAAGATAPAPTAVPPVASDSAVNARNPFLHAPSPTPTPTESPTPSPTAAPSPTPTSANPGTPVVTTTPDPSVYLALYSLSTSTKKAVFRVASGADRSTQYSVSPEHTFGSAGEFSYLGTTKESGSSTTCTLVKYVDEQYTVCPGDLQKVH